MSIHVFTLFLDAHTPQRKAQQVDPLRQGYPILQASRRDAQALT